MHRASRSLCVSAGPRAVMLPAAVPHRVVKVTTGYGGASASLDEYPADPTRLKRVPSNRVPARRCCRDGQNSGDSLDKPAGASCRSDATRVTPALARTHMTAAVP